MGGAVFGESPGRQTWSTARVVLAVTAALLAAACTYVAVGTAFVPGMVPTSWTAPQRTVDREADVIAAAREVTNRLATTDYRTVAEDNDRFATLLTGRYSTVFEGVRADLVKEARAEHGIATGSVLQVAIHDLNATTAHVQVAADSTLVADDPATSKDGTTKQVTTPLHYRWDLTMQKVGDRWLLENLVLVQ